MRRPPFNEAWSNFMRVNVSVAQVGQVIGGKVGKNVADGTFENACPIRMSYVLNYSGVPVPHGPFATVSGADHKWYMYHVNDMMTFLRQTFGKPDVEINRAPHERDFSGKRGIVVVQGSGWSNARGHVTLWDGHACSDRCHLTADPENGMFVPSNAALWVLQ